MKRFLYPGLAVSLFFALFSLNSCQREVDEKLAAQPPISSKDPAKLSASLKVWHGTRTSGNPPPPTGNNPALDPTANPSVLAIAGRYAIIKPEITNGYVAGYYVGVPGAGQYFKVDFKKPRNIAGRGINPTRSGFMQRVTTGTADSSIVIVLPPNINVPDTFCVTYCPYDSLGNIGQPVTTCIYVTSLGAGTGNGWLQNDFKLTSSWDLTNGLRTNVDTIIFNKWAASYEEGYGYYCDQTQNPPILLKGPLNGQPAIISDSAFYIKNNIRFAINGAFDYKDIEQLKDLDQFNSTCSQFTFYPIDNYADSLTGAYSFNSTTNKLILIFEFDGLGLPDPEYWEYDVIKLNNNHFILRDPIENYYIRFER
ncbi:MAG: hypothetical protein SGI83_09695 [Bacteroidota bacterium]|nr:hypothetical protein [Bacteroidota bacterium]